MMRCHIHTEPDGSQLLIPGCWEVVLHWHLPDKEALSFCTCEKKSKKTDKQVIEELRDENTRLKALLGTLEMQLKYQRLKKED